MGNIVNIVAVSILTTVSLGYSIYMSILAMNKFMEESDSSRRKRRNRRKRF